MARFLPYQYMSYPQEVRLQIKKYFKLIPSGSVHVVDNYVEDEGFSEEDFEGITMEEVEEFVSNINKQPDERTPKKRIKQTTSKSI